MPKTKFSRDAFLKANQQAKQGGGSFAPIEKGIYVATIEKAAMKDTTNGARQASFGWQISDEDENHPGQYVWWNQTIVNTDGQVNEVGLQILNQLYYQLSEGQFDPDDFKFDENGEVTNDEDVHEQFHGTVAKIQIIPSGEYNGQTQYKVKVKSVIENAYQERNPMEMDAEIEEMEESATDTDASNTEEQEEGEAKIGDPVVVMRGKTQMRGRILNFIEGQHGQPGMIMIRRTVLADDTFTDIGQNYEPLIATEDEVQLVDVANDNWEAVKHLFLEPPAPPKAPVGKPDEEYLEDEILEDEKTTPILKKGMDVSYAWNGKTLKSTIHSIDEDTGIVKVLAINGEGKKVARSVKMEDIIPF